MAIRITSTTEPHGTTLKIDGWLQQGDVEELLRSMREIEGPTALDLSDLQAVDRTALAALREVLKLRVQISAVSPYVRTLLGIEPGRQDEDDGTHLHEY